MAVKKYIVSGFLSYCSGVIAFSEVVKINCLKSEINKTIRKEIYKRFAGAEITINKAVRVI